MELGTIAGQTLGPARVAHKTTVSDIFNSQIYLTSPLNNMLNNMLLSKFIMPIFIAYFKYMYMYFGLNCSADTITSCITKLTGLASVFIASFIIGLFYQVAL